jgi:HEAT repeat protein
MAIRFSCPICQAQLSAPDGTEGRKSSCRKCGQRIEVPGESTNKTVLGRLTPQQGLATKLMHAVSSGPDYDPLQVFASLFGPDSPTPLSTGQIDALLAEDWRSLRDSLFEDFIVRVFRALGYQAERKGGKGDRGLDILLAVGSNQICIQTKGYSNKLDAQPIREAVTGREYHKCDFCIVITNSEFTEDARETARGVSCGLIEGMHIPDLIRGIFIPPAALVSGNALSVANPSLSPPRQQPAPSPALPPAAAQSVVPTFPPLTPAQSWSGQPALSPTHCFKCGGKLNNLVECHICLESFCSEDCLEGHKKKTGHFQSIPEPRIPAPPEPDDLRSDFGTAPDKWVFDSSSETGKMHTASCPNCGSKRNYRHHSCGTLQPCTSCGAKFELPYPPRRRPERNDGMALAIGVVVIAVFFMCSLPFWAFRGSSTGENPNRQDHVGDKVQFARRDGQDQPDQVGRGKAEAKRRVEEETKRLADEKRKAEEEAKVKAQREAVRKQPLSELRQTLKGNDPKHRMFSAEALGERGAAAGEAVPDLMAALQDQDSNVGREAAVALGMIGPPAKPALVALIQAVGSSDQGIAQAAKQAVAKIGPLTKNDIPALMASLKENNRPVRLFALATLTQLGADAKGAVPAIAALVTDADEAVWSESLITLEKLGPVAEAAIPSLLPLLKDKDSTVRLRVAEVVAAIGTFRAVPAVETLSEFLKPKEATGIRLRAIAALAKLGPEAWPGVRPLIQAIKDKDSEIRSTATDALGKIGKEAVPVLVEALQGDINSNVRLACCQALGEIGPEAKDAIPVLRATSTEDRNKDVQKAALVAIDKIQRKK